MFNKKLKLAYNYQKNSAKRRNIEWDLTFDEWLKIWVDSGKLHLRGKRKGCYCMSRYDDVGPYSKNNVRIDTIHNNLGERWARPVKINGIVYSSISNYSRVTGINRSNVYYFIRKGLLKCQKLAV